MLLHATLDSVIQRNLGIDYNDGHNSSGMKSSRG